jgi:hypothetical protein
LAVEIKIERCAYQGNAAEAGEGRAGKPSERRVPPLLAVEPLLTQSNWRLDSEVGADRRAVPAGAQPRKSSRQGRQIVVSLALDARVESVGL